MSRRIASLAAEAKTKEELEAVPTAEGDSDPEDTAYELKDVKTAPKKQPLPPSGKRGAGGGIYLSDEEEEEAFATTANKDEKSTPAKEEASAPSGSDLQNDQEPQEQKLSKKKRENADMFSSCSSLGSILNRINQPKKKKKKRKKNGAGATMDKSIARLLATSNGNGVKREDARAAAKAALLITGKMKVSEEVKFAGKSINVVRTVDKSSDEAQRLKEEAAKEKGKTTLDKIVDELKNPKKALSSVEKSSYDWEKFKEDKGIGEELEKYAKDGYVEKQQFLQRVDVRQFEVEKAERDRARAMAAAAEAKASKK